MAAAEAVLVSTSRALLAVVGRRVLVVHEGAGLYFGIAELDGCTYVGCHHQLIPAPTVAELDAQQGSLLVLDDRLRVVDERRPDGRPLRQPHGLAAIDGRIWMACSYDDAIEVHDPASGSWERWVPDRGHGPPRTSHDDRFHYNALRPHGDGLLLLAHNYGRSDLLRFDGQGRELVEATSIGVGAHDVFEVEGGPAVASSLESALRSTTGWVRRVGGFPRGVARASDGGWWVGQSTYSGRGDRHRTDGSLQRFDGDWALDVVVDLPALGQVLDVHRWSGDPEALASLSERTECSVAPAGPVEQSRATAYRVPISFPPAPDGSWHEGEPDQQWMAARRATLPVVVNPGEVAVEVEAVSYRPRPAPLVASLDGWELGEIRWERPGPTRAVFPIPDALAPDPASTCGRALELSLAADELWQPDGDSRRIGPGLRTVSFWTEEPSAAP